MAGRPVKELIALVADKSMKVSLEALLRRHRALKMRKLHPTQRDIVVQSNFDAGVFLAGPEFLRTQQKRYRYGLVMCDRHGCGRESLTREELEVQMEERLGQAGWQGRAAAIVIDPELEVWLWVDSPHLDEILGWRGRQPPLRDWLRSQGYLEEGQVKPRRPQQCFEEVLAHAQKRRSSSIFGVVAERVSLRGCTDPSFLKLNSVLRTWFPPID